MSVIELNSEIIENQLFDIAQKMIIAAQTAPKARGLNCLKATIINKETIEMVAFEMKKIAIEHNLHFFERDANSILKSPVIVLIGCTINPVGLSYCGYCGLENCTQKNQSKNVPCAFNLTDLGIAIGSAVSIASNFHIDNRVMFSVGKAAMKIGIVDDDIKVLYGIPLSVSSKNIFFDR